MDDALSDRLQAATASFEATRQAVEAGAPWPLAATFDHSDEAHWGPPEVLAHVAEMTTYWLGEMERILAGDPQPVPFGRIATDTLRLGVLERDRSLPPRELYDRSISALARLDKRWRSLSPDELARRVSIHASASSPSRRSRTASSSDTSPSTSHSSRSSWTVADLRAAYSGGSSRTWVLRNFRVRV